MRSYSCVHGLDANGYLPPAENFIAEEQLFKPKPNGTPFLAQPGDIRNVLREAGNNFTPMWFHQGIDLVIFNICSEAVRQAFAALHRSGHLIPPQTLEDWERQCKMWILLFRRLLRCVWRPRREIRRWWCGRFVYPDGLGRRVLQ